MEQQAEEQARAEAAQWRREESAWLFEEIAAVSEKRDYFSGLIHNNDQKLIFLEMLMDLVDTSTEQGWEEYDMFVNQTGRVYETNWEYQQQFDELDTHLSDLNFELFIMEQQWQQEDEAAFLEDAARAQEQFDDYQAEIDDIQSFIGDTFEMDES